MHFMSCLRPGRGVDSFAAWPLVLALALCPPAQAAPGTLDFADAIELAVQRAPSLDARAARIAAAREEAAQAAALPDPELIAGIENLPVSGGRPLDMDSSDMTMKKIGLMQAFPARAKREARQAVADRLVDQAQALSAIEALEVREETARAWLSAWAADQELAVLRRLRGQASTAVQLAEARLRGGTGSAVDAMAVKAAALEVDNRVDAAEAALAAARAGLQRWLGDEADASPAVGRAPDLASLPVQEAVLLATAAEQRRLVDWRMREAIAEARLAEAIADTRPDWSVMAGYGQRGGGRDDMLMVEFRIDLPLFARNRQDRLVAARRAELQATAAERQDAERAQREAVRRALADWRGLQAQVERHRTQLLPLAGDRAQAALAAYAAGGTAQPWLDARRDELEAHLMHVRHLGELGRVWASLAYLLPEEAAR